MVILLLLALINLPPAPTKYVTDAANVLPDDREHALNEKLAQYQRDTSNQLIVYVDRRVPSGTTLEEMGAEAIRTWAVGDAKKDNGAILFFFIDDRESRIEVGYGLEGVLTDAQSKRILVTLRPALREGDYIRATEEGAARIMATLSGSQTPVVPPQPVVATSAETSDETVVVVLFVLAFFGVVIFIIIGVVKGFITLDSSPGTVTYDSDSSSSSWDHSSSSSWSSSSSDSSSSSSSDFSGGGGSGGGGGASDKW